MTRTPAEHRTREPLQIYLTSDERRLLDTLAEATQLSRAEVLRRGLRSFAAERAGNEGPMYSFMKSMREHRWPSDIATAHDDHLAKAYADRNSE
jgi:hypothetical protein